jgi:uncharacterized membrane protein
MTSHNNTTQQTNSRLKGQKLFFFAVHKRALITAITRYITPKDHFFLGIIIGWSSVFFLTFQPCQFMLLTAAIVIYAVSRFDIRRLLQLILVLSTCPEVPRVKFSHHPLPHVLIVERVVELNVDECHQEAERCED